MESEISIPISNSLDFLISIPIPYDLLTNHIISYNHIKHIHMQLLSCTLTCRSLLFMNHRSSKVTVHQILTVSVSVLTVLLSVSVVPTIHIISYHIISYYIISYHSPSPALPYLPLCPLYSNNTAPNYNTMVMKSIE